MRLVVKKSDREKIRSCCGRQPFVGSFIDFEDNCPPEFSLFCPVCERVVTTSSFIESRRAWNEEVMSDEISEYINHTFVPEVDSDEKCD